MYVLTPEYTEEGRWSNVVEPQSQECLQQAKLSAGHLSELINVHHGNLTWGKYLQPPANEFWLSRLSPCQCRAYLARCVCCVMHHPEHDGIPWAHRLLLRDQRCQGWGILSVCPRPRTRLLDLNWLYWGVEIVQSLLQHYLTLRDVGRLPNVPVQASSEVLVIIVNLILGSLDLAV